MYKTSHISLLIISCIFFCCQNSPSKTIVQATKLDTTLPSWAQDAVIYEVNIRQYTKEGTFRSFAKHLPRLKELGVDILWFMPIFPISKTKRKGSLGSYYSVNDYKAINPEFGTIEDFDWLVNQIHDLDMHIILDWVPNHTGWDHSWIKSNPEWYTKDSLGQITDPFDPKTGKSWGWTDVADLDYSKRDLRQEMIKDMMFWINEKNIDGFRQDVAENVPDQFWSELKKVIYNSGKPIFMLAEAEHPFHRNSESFHASYGWSFHSLLNQIAKGEKKAVDILKWAEEDKTKFHKGFQMNFTTNHDENTWNGTVFERMGDAHKTLAALTFVVEGMPLIYSGQEEPIKHRLKFFEKDNIKFDKYEYQNFYKNLTELKHSNQALWNGKYGASIDDIGSNDYVYAIKRQKGKNLVHAIFNLSNNAQEIKLDKNIKGQEFNTNLIRSFTKDSTISLKPWEYIILTSNI